MDLKSIRTRAGLGFKISSRLQLWAKVYVKNLVTPCKIDTNNTLKDFYLKNLT